MIQSLPLLNPAQAAHRLGVSVKALRLYEKGGLLHPQRNAAGWRFYDAEAMARGEQIATLRALGMSLSRIARVLAGDAADLRFALARHRETLGDQLEAARLRLDRLTILCDELDAGRMDAGRVMNALVTQTRPDLAFDLPWPWNGERFEIARLAPVTYLTGPLGSGKTRLAMALAQHLPSARFSALDRIDGKEARARLKNEPELREIVEPAVQWLEEEGAEQSDALLAVMVALLGAAPGAAVVDLVEEGLDEASQEALGTWLRHHGSGGNPLVVMTRSSAVLDLDAVSPGHAVLYCPANHHPPFYVTPHLGAPGFESVASCLASPQIRRRSAGLRVVRA